MREPRRYYESKGSGPGFGSSSRGVKRRHYEIARGRRGIHRGARPRVGARSRGQIRHRTRDGANTVHARAMILARLEVRFSLEAGEVPSTN